MTQLEMFDTTNKIERSGISSTDTNEKCAFCKIIRGEENSYAVFEDEMSLAFLDRRPLFPGHCLLIPNAHYETLADLPPVLINPLFSNAQMLARVVEKAMDAEGTFIAINNRVSQSVPHLHIHVVPRRKNDGLKGFFWPRQPYKSEEDMVKVQNMLKASIVQLRSG